jgi:hypothetical protein
LEKRLAGGDAEGLVTVYNALLASIPYDIYEREEKEYAEKRELNYISRPKAESFYHALLFSLLWSSRARTTAEGHSYWGRSDVEAEINGRRYVVELKIAEGQEAAKKAAETAMRQIREKGYADKYAAGGAALVALAVDREQRRVTAHKIEKL